MNRRLLTALAARAKSTALIDLAVRYNPWLRQRVRNALNISGSAAQARQIDWLSRRIVAAARRTRYGAGGSERFDEWPVLSKDRPLAAPQDFVNPRSWIRIPASTGGTTGAPLRLWRTLECAVAEQAFLDGMLAAHGFSMRSKVAVLRADNIKPAGETDPPYWRLTHDGARLTMSSLHLNTGSLPWYVDELERFAPSVLWVYPSAVINLLRLMQRSNRRLSVPVILASSELLSARVHTELERFFSARVVNYYGQAERACLAWSVRPDEFFFNPLYGRVQLQTIPAAGTAPAAARIIATGFWNTAMPLIRYDTGDLLYLPDHSGPGELEQIARGERAFVGLAGRSGEYLLTREGLRIIGLNHIPRDVEHIHQVQLVQSDWNTLDIRVLAAQEFGAADEQTLLAQARAKLPASFAVTVKRVEQLRQSAGGKIPFVIRDLKP